MILHCFSAPQRVADAAERGWYCSFAGNVTYPSSEALREAAAKVPEDRILVETDAPYLTPQEMRGERNQPANVVATARVVAAARGVSYEELERTVEANAARALRLVAAMVRLGQNFLADPNLLDAIVRDAELAPATWCSRSARGRGC